MELTYRQQTAIEDVQRALAEELAGDLPAGVDPANGQAVAEYWRSYLRLQLQGIAKVFPDVTP
jgi:NAD(P)H-hydrate repair Nnr-like enzyme with NAD(P)H-hydrate epimerase domain